MSFNQEKFNQRIDEILDEHKNRIVHLENQIELLRKVLYNTTLKRAIK